MCGLRFVIFVARRFRIGFAGLPGGISAGKRSRFFRRERRSERNLRSALKSGIKRAFYIFGRLNKFKTVCRIDRFVLEKERVFSIFNAIFAILSCYMLRHFRTNDVHLHIHLPFSCSTVNRQFYYITFHFKTKHVSFSYCFAIFSLTLSGTSIRPNR